MLPFLICDFGKPTISNLVKECFGSAFPDIYSKKQVDYIYRYLKDLGARSVLLEPDYVDKDYLEDYTRFYAHRFSNRGHRCARLHFFSDEVTHPVFDALLQGASTEELEKTYLGFVVIKPLPKTFIGKTCLKPYKSLENSKNMVSLKRAYPVNLFGIDLRVNTIAFQEQDRVVSACATTSIWSALNALDWFSLRDISSCSAITTNAINLIEGSSNNFPRAELSNKQILRALDAERLRHHNHSLVMASREDAKVIIRSYLRSGLPLVLGSDVYKLNGARENADFVAGHAATIVGCKFGVDDECIYLHDDRFGPFARARLIDLSDYAPISSFPAGRAWGLALQDKSDQGEWEEIAEILLPNSIIGMTHNKVRIPFDFVRKSCELIVDLHQQALEKMKQSADGSAYAIDNPVGFEIQLTDISKFKRQVYVSKFQLEESASAGESEEWRRIYQQQKISLLTKSLARFQWVIYFAYGGSPAFTLLVDATDIPQGDVVSVLYIDMPTNCDAIIQSIKSLDIQSHDVDIASSGTFVGSFLRKLDPSVGGLQEHLNINYGEPRAPKRLKVQEIDRGGMRANATLIPFYEAVACPIEVALSKLLETEEDVLIWVIDIEGTLIIGKERDSMGHPTLTGFKPARIAGELFRSECGWKINSKSGRYSGNYEETGRLLENALGRFKSIFFASRDSISIEPRTE